MGGCYFFFMFHTLEIGLVIRPHSGEAATTCLVPAMSGQDSTVLTKAAIREAFAVFAFPDREILYRPERGSDQLKKRDCNRKFLIV